MYLHVCVYSYENSWDQCYVFKKYVGNFYLRKSWRFLFKMMLDFSKICFIKKASNFSRKLPKIVFITLAHAVIILIVIRVQGCQIFHGTKYHNGENVYQITINCTKMASKHTKWTYNK
jgi:hypothetical protein